MVERVEGIPEGFTDKDKAARESVIREAFTRGEIHISPEIAKAVAAIKAGRGKDNPLVQELVAEDLIDAGTSDIPEDLAWVWDQVVTPPDERK